MRQQLLVIQIIRVLSANPRAWPRVHRELSAVCHGYDKLVIVTASSNRTLCLYGIHGNIVLTRRRSGECEILSMTGGFDRAREKLIKCGHVSTASA
jgi:hypothetical protein